MNISQDAPSGRKRGRKPQHFQASDGTVINGLARRPSDGRWRIIGTGITFSEPDESLAIHRFRMWQAQQKRDTIRVPRAAARVGDRGGLQRAVESLTPPQADPRKLRGTFLPPALLKQQPSPLPGTPTKIELSGDQIEFYGEPINADAFWPWLRRLILDRSQLVAQRTGIAEIAYLADLPKPKPSPTLAEIGKLYVEKAQITGHERKKSELFWREFMETIGVETVREVTAEKASVYLDHVLSAGKSPTYAFHRFGKIKTMLHYARKRGIAPNDVRKALDACAVLVPPKRVSLDPHPIDPKDFHKLLAKADDQMTAILLLALNCCMYGAEVADVRWADIDLELGVLVMDRGKTGVARVAALWPRTVEAIKKLPHRTESPFVSIQGVPMTVGSLAKPFRRLRTAAAVSDEVKFADIRDAAYTAAACAPGVAYEQARILAGHRTGMADHYVKRRPRIVADACQAIHDEFFGK